MKCCKRICHKKCIQDEAILGKQYCPKCSNPTTEKYIFEMLYYGIYFKGYDNERNFVKVGKTLPSQNIEKLLEQKTKQSGPKKLTQTSQSNSKTEEVELKTKDKVVESKNETVETTPEEMETEIMEDCEAQKEIDSCSKKHKVKAFNIKITKSDIEKIKENCSEDVHKMMQTCEAQDELLELSVEEMDSSSKKSKTSEVEQTNELVETSEKEIQACSKEYNSEAVNTKLTKNNVEKIELIFSADDQEMMENCEAQDKLLETSEEEMDSSSNKSKTEEVEQTNELVETSEREIHLESSSVDEEDIIETNEAEDGLLETSEEEIGTSSKEANSEAVNTKFTKNCVEENTENSGADEQVIKGDCEAQNELVENPEKEIDSWSKEYNSKAGFTKITNSDVKEMMETNEAEKELLETYQEEIDPSSNSEAVTSKITKKDVKHIKENSAVDEQKIMKVCGEEMDSSSKESKTEEDNIKIMETVVDEIEEVIVKVVSDTQYVAEKLNLSVEETSKTVAIEKEERKQTETYFAKAIREKDEAKVALDSALATEKAAADNHIILLLLAARVCYEKLKNLKTRKIGFTTIAHLAYYEKYIELYKRRSGTEDAKILEDCLKRTTVEECLKTAVDKKLMEIKKDLDGEKNWYIEDTRVKNGARYKSLQKDSIVRAKKAINARIEAEEAFIVSMSHCERLHWQVETSRR